jgi:hypothetical protein
MMDGSVGQRAHVPGEHAALSSYDANVLAIRMIKHAAASGDWQYLPDHLAELRAVASPPQLEAA